MHIKTIANRLYQSEHDGACHLARNQILRRLTTPQFKRSKTPIQDALREMTLNSFWQGERKAIAIDAGLRLVDLALSEFGTPEAALKEWGL